MTRWFPKIHVPLPKHVIYIYIPLPIGAMNIQFSNWQNSKWPSSLAHHCHHHHCPLSPSSSASSWPSPKSPPLFSSLSQKFTLNCCQTYTYIYHKLMLVLPSIYPPGNYSNISHLGKTKIIDSEVPCVGFFCDMWSFPGGVGLKTHPSPLDP